MESISGDLIPFGGVFDPITRFLRSRGGRRGDITLADDIEGGIGARTHYKHRPRVAGGGENIPLEVLRALSCWLSALESRGSVYGMLKSPSSYLKVVAHLL